MSAGKIPANQAETSTQSALATRSANVAEDFDTSTALADPQEASLVFLAQLSPGSPAFA